MHLLTSILKYRYINKFSCNLKVFSLYFILKNVVENDRKNWDVMFPLFFIDILVYSILRYDPSMPKNILTLIMCFDQIRIILTTKSNSIYNKNLALILISSNTLKIMYWFFEPFSVLVFGQCIALWVTQFVLTYLNFKYSDDEKPFFPNAPTVLNRSRFSKPNSILSLFKITNARTFIEFCVYYVTYALTAGIVFVLACLVFGSSISIEALGLLGNLIDVLIPFPMFTKLVIRRDITNLSTVLLVQFVGGDIMKLVIFAASHSPWQFMLAGSIQIVLDSLSNITYFTLSYFQKKREICNPDEQEVPQVTSLDDSDN